MPTNLVNPPVGVAVDRLNLGIDSPRGATPAHPGVVGCAYCARFEVESSGFGSGWHVIAGICCFEAEASAQYCAPFCSCMETE